MVVEDVDSFLASAPKGISSMKKLDNQRHVSVLSLRLKLQSPDS